MTDVDAGRPAHDRIPARAGLDRTAGLLVEGYPFLAGRRRRWGSDGGDAAVELRLLGERAVCVGGPEAVRLFYEPERFRRRDAAPRPLATTLFGRNAVHLLDGPAHRHRKAMFLSLLDPAAAREIAAVADRLWQAAVDRWGGGRPVAVFDEAVRVFGVAVCGWAGLPLTAENARRRVWDLERIMDGFGGVGPRHAAARLARERSERWVRKLVRDVRAARHLAPPGSALQVIAWHQELDGMLLDEQTAAVELLNIVRPTVAVAWFVAFAALALHQQPQWRARLGRDPDAALEGDLEAFAHELRRLYPFTPMLGARVERPFSWRRHRFPEGQLVLLDVYGTNHDPQLWPDPDAFDPDRFGGHEPDRFAFVPHGGGDPATGHRCPGERVTVELLKGAVRVLAGLHYDVPDQDLRYPLSRMPTRPRSGFTISDVHQA
jgi:fatty-acid peroxygenase